ncbi:hypothetical protein AB2L28_09135 [Kineococcus sp. TBRC 1896]|uniref:Uncharacterized protein n=1 Tax=Kineococcus mangrovi TaxID=1660183 RepID=A0ABV4I5A6_9ACTN
MPNLLVPFDLDCGEVVPGRHLWLRGLLDDGTWPDADGNRLPDAAGDSTQMVSLAWEVVPPVGPDDPDAETWYQSDLASVRYEVEPPLSWDIDTAQGVGGGSMDTPPGRPASRGSEGPYPLSPEARRVTFTVTPYTHRRRGEGGPGGVSWVVQSAGEPAGRAVIDLDAREAS